MKRNLRIFLLLIAVGILACSTPRTTVEKAQVQEKIAKMVQDQNFIFNATNANPQRIGVLNILPNGGGQQLQHLSPGYYLSVTGDSLKVYLPFFGRAYQANFNNKDNGIEFETTDFKYGFSKNRHGYYHVTISVNNQQAADKFILDVSEGGYSTLQVQSSRRDQMGFYGEIKPTKSDISL